MDAFFNGDDVDRFDSGHFHHQSMDVDVDCTQIFDENTNMSSEANAVPAERNNEADKDTWYVHNLT